MKDSEMMKEAFEESVKEITQVLKRKKTNTDITKLAAGTLGVYSRIIATEVHQEALRIMIEKQKVKKKLLD